MQFPTTSTLFLVLTIASLPISTEGTFRFLFNTLFSPLVGRACDLAQSELGLENFFNCNCNLDYAGLGRGFDGSVACTTKNPTCLVPPGFYCASGKVDFGLKAGLFVPTGLNSDIKACFNVASNLPANVTSFNDFCFTFKTKGFGFDSCVVKIGTTQCNSCTICETGTDFKFDCANVDLFPPDGGFFIPGPNITQCIGLSTLPTPSTNLTIPI